ncbi:MAG: hypothetical protein Q9219_001708 [cf. Caloplaca sp. 3 TL-2023]
MHSQDSSRIHLGHYEIQRIPTTPLPVEVHAATWKFSNSVALSLYLAYIVLQCYSTILIQRDSTYAVLVFSLILGLSSFEKDALRPTYLLVGDAAPCVDVLITCCGESVDTIIDTAIAAATQDYPAGCLRVFVLDDGQSNKLRHAIETLNVRLSGTTVAPITYLARSKLPGIPSFFKAGNLRFGIDESERSSGALYFASLDADMVPERDWLRRMIPHLILDDDLGMAVTPQCLYNVPESDPLGQQAEFSSFFAIQEVLNDQAGAAMCTGTGYVARRNALISIGGWPLAEAGEDFMCSALLSSAGWKIAFVREDLQFGLAPDSLRAMVKQRMRWVCRPHPLS